jgi:hypothetical protein
MDQLAVFKVALVVDLIMVVAADLVEVKVDRGVVKDVAVTWEDILGMDQ